MAGNVIAMTAQFSTDIKVQRARGTNYGERHHQWYSLPGEDKLWKKGNPKQDP